jgi:hypothetical protein
MCFQQRREDQRREDISHRIADGHQRDPELAHAIVGEFRRGRIDRRQHAANPQAREETPGRELLTAVHLGAEKHSDGHDNQECEDGAAPPDDVGDATQDERPHGHAQQIHRQHQTQAHIGRNLEFLHDAGRGEADRQQVEPVECIQEDGDGAHDDLQLAHRRGGEHAARIVVHHCWHPPDTCSSFSMARITSCSAAIGRRTV